ncbi:pantoate--beta-alanine ligase [Dactylosporangium sp. CA-139066]|uniref:pantoate--beta-alanine ligase n=1 Tax=Dactylosporangium sp. CA-139066 TaxID=3239930 RepID=UPI003D8CF695
MKVATTREELRAARPGLTGEVAVVMTMGALHAGHEALLRRARADADSVLLTIFVNPLQFGPAEDFDRYPRTFEADLELARSCGVDLVFAPTREVMYPGGDPAVRVDPGPWGSQLEGASRPGFFHGVLTVVNKLFQLTRPDVAYFGEKDFQQLTLIRAMARDFDLPIDVRGVPTVREPDGLALSSRNRYLSPVEREQALVLHRALAAAVAGGVEAGLAEYAKVPEVKVDYLVAAEGRMLTAAWVGGTRLIDNLGIDNLGIDNLQGDRP